MQRKIGLKAVIAITLIALMSGIAVASFLLKHDIQTSVIVKPVVSMGVYDTDGITPLNSIALGQFSRGDFKYFPGGTADTPIQFYYINNTDQMNFYVDFTWKDLPPGSDNFGWDVWIKRGDQTSFTKLGGRDEVSIYSLPIMTHLEDPDPLKQYAIFYFGFTIDGNCPFATYNPTLTINAYDSTSG